MGGAGAPITREAADVLMPPADEVQLGLQVRGEVLRQEKPLTDEAVQAHVRTLGDRLVKLTPESDAALEPTFTVLDSPKINAFAIPGWSSFHSSHPTPQGRNEVLTAQLNAAGNPGGNGCAERFDANKARLPVQRPGR